MLGCICEVENVFEEGEAKANRDTVREGELLLLFDKEKEDEFQGFFESSEKEESLDYS